MGVKVTAGEAVIRSPREQGVLAEPVSVTVSLSNGSVAPEAPTVTTITRSRHPEVVPVSESIERRLLTPEEYEEAQASPEFMELRKRFRSFAFPMTVAFLAWYLAYVLLSTYASDFMSIQVFGNVNVGLLLGLAQFVTTFAITHLYVAHANKRTDPIADEMRERLEHHEYASGHRAGGATGGATRA
jgi:uncharacterized membrane protein (DUF485 family)